MRSLPYSASTPEIDVRKAFISDATKFAKFRTPGLRRTDLCIRNPGWIISVLIRLGGTLASLVLVSVGLQLWLSELAGKRASLAMGLGYKLVLAPLLILLIYAGVIGLRGTTTRVTLFEAAMAPQIGGAIVATQYGLDAQLISLMVGIGTILSFLTFPLWWRILALI
jgi:predicted permease